GWRTLVVAAAALAPAAAFAAPQARPDHILVRSNLAIARGQAQALDAKAGVVEIKWTSSLVPGLRLVRVVPGGVEAALAVFRADPSVQYAAPDYLRSVSSQPLPYGISLVNAPGIWQATPPSASSVGGGVIVADLDTGIDLGHPDLPTPALMQSFV